MKNINILVVEDDIDIQELIKEFLLSEEYSVDTASDGLEGIEKFNKGNYELVILDIMLPKLDGYGVCKMIRSKSSTPIIMLTALNEESDELKGFELKVDDYITKPFSFNILIKRVEAVLRRVYGSENENIIEFKNIKLNCDSYEAYVDDELIELTTKEFEMLKILMKNRGNVIKREVFLDKLWGYDFYGDTRVIDTHIKNIRKKIKTDYIKTVKGVGYKIDD
ncbi:response regulator transcription factor [Clostridium cylindrosporum]|uniref:Stage 0 sporulation protein A homolog n=1 Tax=Clostridium cylindrosporum DSM 605 TaxID=1121307 RepID=A0A0J8D4U6_CLOCY|nr:response regulator transcription factor [Clostridium cylindrosporum]KMT21185.1 response regulator [Clostridium cylindrosporum DSM 605]